MRAPTRHLRLTARIVSLSVALFTTACGGDSQPAAPSTGSPPPTSSGGPINVKGTEKIGWDQVADSASQLLTYQYLGYVDSVPQVLANAVCASSPTNGAFPCTASLPRMSAGMHTLELAAQEMGGAQRVSGRSAALQL